MAKISLEPKEQFEHFHLTESYSTLIKGSIKFSIENEFFYPKEGDTITIPAKKIHCMENVGDIVAIIDCAHYPPKNAEATR